MERRRRAPGERAVCQSLPTRLGTRLLTPMRTSLFARPPDHRLPDESLHEAPSDRHRRRGRRQGRFQPSHRLSPRAGSPSALAEEGATWTTPTGSAGRGVAERGSADARGGTRVAGRGRVRRIAAPASRARQRGAAHPRAPDPRLARHAWPGAGGDLPPGARGLSGISCVGGHDGSKGAPTCHDAKSPRSPMPCSTSC